MCLSELVHFELTSAPAPSGGDITSSVGGITSFITSSIIFRLLKTVQEAGYSCFALLAGITEHVQFAVKQNTILLYTRLCLESQFNASALRINYRLQPTLAEFIVHGQFVKSRLYKLCHTM